jgi:hypothetical protein
MSRMRLLIVSGRTHEQGSYGDLGQGEALVEDDGQEPVGQGKHGAPAGAGGGQPGAVAAALVQARFPLLVVEGQQRGDQGIPRLFISLRGADASRDGPAFGGLRRRASWPCWPGSAHPLTRAGGHHPGLPLLTASCGLPASWAGSPSNARAGTTPRTNAQPI